MEDTPADNAELTNHYLDLEEAQKHCHQREVAAFGQAAVERPREAIHVRARREVGVVMARLLYRYEAMDWMPSALTILDALGSQMAMGKEAASALRTTARPACLAAAVVRLVLKQAGVTGPHACQADLCDDIFAQHLTEMGDGELEAPELITQTEVDVVNVMEGRVALSSPTDWANLIIDRVRLLVALRPPTLAAGWHAAAQLPPDMTERVVSWASCLAQAVAATAELPPRALGLTACVCALAVCGALPASEAWPRDSPHGSFLPPATTGHVVAPFLQAATLAEAAGCSEQELHAFVRAGSAALLAASFGESGPDQRSN